MGWSAWRCTKRPAQTAFGQDRWPATCAALCTRPPNVTSSSRFCGDDWEQRLQKEIDDRVVERADFNKVIDGLRKELDDAHDMLSRVNEGDAEATIKQEQLEEERESAWPISARSASSA